MFYCMRLRSEMLVKRAHLWKFRPQKAQLTTIKHLKPFMRADALTQFFQHVFSGLCSCVIKDRPWKTTGFMVQIIVNSVKYVNELLKMMSLSFDGPSRQTSLFSSGLWFARLSARMPSSCVFAAISLRSKSFLEHLWTSGWVFVQVFWSRCQLGSQSALKSGGKT